MRNGDVSYWWHDRGGFPPRRPSLPGPAEADVCIVGAGFTGLWTAWYLKRAEPGLRVIVLEAAFAGFGASGRNGGWLTAALPGSRDRYARGPRGRAGVLDMQRQLQQTVDEVAAVCAAEGIDAHLVKGGSLSVAFTPAQHERLREALRADRAWGLGRGRCPLPGPRRHRRPDQFPGRARRALHPALRPGAAGPAWWPGWPRRPSARGRRSTRRPRSPRSSRTWPARCSATSPPGMCCGPPRGSPPGCPASAARCCR